MTVLDDILEKAKNVTDLNDVISISILVAETYNKCQKDIESIKIKLDEAVKDSASSDVICEMKEKYNEMAVTINTLLSISANATVKLGLSSDINRSFPQPITPLNFEITSSHMEVTPESNPVDIPLSSVQLDGAIKNSDKIIRN